MGSTRSDAVRDVLRIHLQHHREQRDAKGPSVANLSCVYTHRERELIERAGCAENVLVRSRPLPLLCRWYYSSTSEPHFGDLDVRRWLKLSCAASAEFAQ